MQKNAGAYRPLYYGLLGGLAGAAAGGGMEKYLKDSWGTGAGLGGSTGFLAGVLAGIAKNRYEKAKTLTKLKPGLYVAQRPLWAAMDSLNDLPVISRNARHSMLLGIFSKPPRGIQTVPLPNGQYATVMSGVANHSGDRRFSKVYLTLNGETGTQNADGHRDIAMLNALFGTDPKNPFAQGVDTFPVSLNKDKFPKYVKSLQDIILKNKGIPVADYSLASDEGTGNCNTISAALLGSLGDPNLSYPSSIGGYGKVYLDDSNYRSYTDKLPALFKSAKAMGVFTEFKGKPVIKTIKEDPVKWNRRNEMDILPIPGTRATLACIAGILGGGAYGLHKYLKGNEKPSVGGALAAAAANAGLG